MFGAVVLLLCHPYGSHIGISGCRPRKGRFETECTVEELPNNFHIDCFRFRENSCRKVAKLRKRLDLIFGWIFAKVARGFPAKLIFEFIFRVHLVLDMHPIHGQGFEDMCITNSSQQPCTSEVVDFGY